MATTRETRDGDVIVVEGNRPPSRGPALLVALLVIIVIAVIAFFALGGDAEVDDDGDVNIEAPDVELPDIDVNVDNSDTPDVNVEGGEAPDVDVEEGNVEGGEAPDVDVESGN